MVATKSAGSFPAEILTQHTAILGKTGAGKSSTAKLLIEQVVADGARVCILDPIKSDWWGLTSSADGKRPGLPFHILGGPRGHVPLHSSAGKAVGEIVASGTLPLSILDMAEFEPGGQAKFFVDFAPTLLRRMRGVVYLVIEEAHLFAPKERSGLGAENLAIHWAKTLATAGRSKGIRLILVTQRTQALHNALLGSCDTLIAHRLTAPADQEPVVKWLKANTSRDVLERVSSSLSSLKTGHGWICSGEARLFELRAFPRITTYDNTATPSGDTDTAHVRTAPVDQEKLRAIIGDAVAEAAANDPKELRRRVGELERQLAKAQQDEVSSKPSPEATPVLTDADRELLARLSADTREMRDGLDQAIQRAAERVRAFVEEELAELRGSAATWRDVFAERLERAGVRDILATLDHVAVNSCGITSTPGASIAPPVNKATRSTHISRQSASGGRVSATRPEVVHPPARPVQRAGQSEAMPPGEKAVLTAAAMYKDGVTRDQLGVLTGYKRSSRDAYIARLAGKGWVSSANGHVVATPAGVDALGADFEPLPTGAALLDWWRARLPKGERDVLEVLVASDGQDVSREAIDKATGFKRSSRDAYLSRLASRRLVQSAGPGMVRASQELFG